MAAAQATTHGGLSATVAETLALRWAISITRTRSLGYQHVLFESNAKTLVDRWNKRGGASYLDSLIRDCKAEATHFSSLKLQFAPRTVNTVADYLVKKAFSLPSRVWVDGFPPDVETL